MIGAQKKKKLQDRAYNEGTIYQFEQFKQGGLKLGPWTSYSMIHDPKHMCFVLSRYKFVARMLEGKDKVLEIGCGDGFGFPIVAQAVSELHGVDRDERHPEGNRQRLNFIKNAKFYKLDAVLTVPETIYDAIYALDVIEHLVPGKEKAFLLNITKGLKKDGICIIGTPNITAEEYAENTHRSAVQHINLMGHKELRACMQKYFNNVFLFSMNDEVVHTGFYPMAHYLFAIGVGLKA